MRLILYRNIRSRESFELFLLSAITSLLAVRFYLFATGYPQVGGEVLHIAHMLWGGLLMLAALVVMFNYLGANAQRFAALVGGAGFGVFIDEIGKFITRDNDYFFRPAVGIIYAIFVILYLLFNFLARKRRLTSREYQLNALAQLEQAVESDMDRAEQARVLELLQQADQTSPLTKKLLAIVQSTALVDSKGPGWAERWRLQLDDIYRKFWQNRESKLLVRIVFVAEALILLASVMLLAYGSFDDLWHLFDRPATYSAVVLAGQLVAAVIAAGFALYGAWLLTKSRSRAFEQFRRATLVNLLLTQVFVFFREQFAAMPGFAFNLALLVVITYVIHQERRLKSAQTTE